jgi:starch synthase (maltosyl-transferring)
MPEVQLETVRDGRQRVIIEGVSPQVDGGRFPIKRIIGDEVTVEADIFADGHDAISATVKARPSSSVDWHEAPMQLLNNDRWRGSFLVTDVALWLFVVEGWIDHFKSWRKELEKKFQAGLDISVELLAGAQLIESSASNAEPNDAQELKAAAKVLKENDKSPVAGRVAVGLSPRIAELIAVYGDRPSVSSSAEFKIIVDRPLAQFGAWYEMFPRSASQEPGRHGTFKDCEALLPRIRRMGFDILYLPPVHPIGQSFRKGRNNNPKAQPGEPGSPWGIGSAEGGHKSIHTELGTLDDFKRLISKAAPIQIALDIAFQCSPDHPYVKEHPEWFKKRPDGTIQYAENPPKKYQDIYPINFETENWESLWQELKSVFEFWIEQGVRIFRVDNPHTKSFNFWEWCIGELKAKTPDLIFLSEAFTRPKLMYYLAKLGFSQSYNYFPWRNTKQELTTYMTEITQGPVRHFFRPNLWPNTPDILTEYLQHGGKPAFMTRLVLAATLGASYGIYGPVYEMAENKPREPGSEEYLNSEKYEIRHWNLLDPGNLTDLIARVNEIRQDNPALQSNESLRFHAVDNEQLLAYSKQTPDRENIILTVVNLDPHHLQRGWVTLPLEQFGLKLADAYQVQELLTNAYYLWSGPRNYVELDPKFIPAHIFRLRRKIRTEHDFDYFF